MKMKLEIGYICLPSCSVCFGLLLPKPGLIGVRSLGMFEMKGFGVVSFFLGFGALTVLLYLMQNYFPAESWVPTLLYVPVLLLVFFGQALVLTILLENAAAGFEWLKLGMFGFVSVLPLLATFSVASTAGYDFMKWSAAVLLAVESAVFLISVFSFSGQAGPVRRPITQ